jgi:hypothetical protein
MIFIRRTLPVLVCFLVGILSLAQYYIPTELSQQALSQGSNWGKIVIGFSYLIGLQSLLHLHWTRIRRIQPGWGYSALVFVGFLPMVFFGLSGEIEKLFEVIFRRELSFMQFQPYLADGKGEWYQWMYDYVYSPASATMFSMLAFFIASAAYRTFRAKTVESALLLVAAVIVIFGRVPISAAISDWFPAAADWIMAYPNMAVKRGILIGVSLGIVGTALRVIFGLERAYVGGD